MATLLKTPETTAEDKLLRYGSVMMPKESSKTPKTFKSKPTCARCKNHGKIVYRKGHSQKCEYLNCKCSPCDAIKLRNVSMARCMSNERKATTPKIAAFAEADSSCAGSSLLNPIKHDFDVLNPMKHDFVKRIKTTPPSTDILTSQSYGYLQHSVDTRVLPSYDCLRPTMDTRPAYNINVYTGMPPFPPPVTSATPEDRKPTILDPYKGWSNTGRGITPSSSYHVNALLRDSSNELMAQQSTYRQLLQTMAQPDEHVMGSTSQHKGL